MAKHTSASKLRFKKRYIAVALVLFYISLNAAFIFGYVSYRDTVEPGNIAALKPPTRAQLLSLVNAEREKAGVAPLDKDVALDLSAQMKADDMDANNYFGHIDKNGKQGYSYIIDVVGTGTCKYVSENISVANTPTGNSAEAHVKSWLGSPAHKAAMIDPKYTVTGFGISGVYVVEHFCQTN